MTDDAIPEQVDEGDETREVPALPFERWVELVRGEIDGSEAA